VAATVVGAADASSTSTQLLGAKISAGIAGPATADAGGNIAVSVVRAASAQDVGIVSVSVPKAMVSSGEGFSFPLPAEMAEVEAGGEVGVTLVNGERLPSWLRYVPATRTFVATAAPAGALPTQVVVRIGSRRWTVVIAERTGR
jgi:hypothetical protein